MSNVLIGIIGVILFIGLALAGALFLGPRFQEATVSSQASAMTASLKQAVDAANLWRLNEGNQRIAQQDTTFLVPGYLKTELINPSPSASGQSSFFWKVYFNDNIFPETVPDVHLATIVQAVIGPQTDSRSKAVCETLERTLTSGAVQTTRDPVTQVGCSLVAGQYVAYAKL